MVKGKMKQSTIIWWASVMLTFTDPLWAYLAYRIALMPMIHFVALPLIGYWTWFWLIFVVHCIIPTPETLYLASIVKKLYKE
jgi:hypothetical protein